MTSGAEARLCIISNTNWAIWSLATESFCEYVVMRIGRSSVWFERYHRSCAAGSRTISATTRATGARGLSRTFENPDTSLLPVGGGR